MVIFPNLATIKAMFFANLGNKIDQIMEIFESADKSKEIYVLTYYINS